MTKTRMEVKLHQGDTLDVLRLDVVDAIDVEEVILVVVREQSLHLGRVHATVRLGDIDDREVQVREDVDRHTEGGQNAPEYNGGDQHHDGKRATEREDDWVHRWMAFE